jgi:hypothetical protein
MKLKPGFDYMFLRISNSSKNGEVLSDSCGSGPRKDLIAWSEDHRIRDIWEFSLIYSELLQEINKCIMDGYEIRVAEFTLTCDLPNIYVITDRNETVSK